MRMWNKSVLILELWAVSMMALAIGCQKAQTETPPGARETKGASPTSVPGEAQHAFDRMDTRIAVPLLPMMANHQKQNMRDHLLAVQEIVFALSTDDFGGVERAAGRIGYTEQMGQMCAHMGAGAPGFTEQSLHFHHTADTITVAARQHDREAVMRALGSTLQTCTACHAAFRQSVVDEAAYQRLTAMPAPSGHASSH